ncbi:MAG: ShlB/FhaC/HecB family hemolysin secretion/activation protein [Moraxella sp.]|nr:ShlB/FhaC/HecB family hemolysin secretion/activation protein [Moraxella sp.]
MSVTTGATALASTIDTEAEAQRYILPEALQRQRDLQLLHHGQQDFGGRLFGAEDLDGLPSTILTPQLSATNPTWTKNQELTDGTPCFMVNSIELALVDDVADLDVENSTEKSSDVGRFYGVLNPLLDASKPTYALGRCLDSHNLSLIHHIAHNELLKLGYLTSNISIPEQDISTGRLRLALHTGKVDGILVAGQAGGRLHHAGFIHQALPIKSGQLFRLTALEQGLDNLKKIDNTAQVRILSAKDATKLGFSDLQISINKTQNISMDVGIDDSLSKAQGGYLASFSLKTNNLMHLNDEWFLSANYPLQRLVDAAQGDLDVALGKDRQLNYQTGLSFYQGFYKFGITHGVHDYRQFVAGFHAPLSYHGTSKTTTLNIARLLHRNAMHKTEGYLKAYHKNSQHFIDDIEIEVQKRRTTGWHAGINHQQYLNDGAYLYANLDYKQGTGALNAQPAPEEEIYDAFGRRLPAEGYAKAPIWSWYLQYQKPAQFHPKSFNQPVKFIHTIKSQGQYAKQLPVAQDWLYLGGRDNMKGTKEGTYLSGEHGMALSYEFAYQLPYQNNRHTSHMYVNFDQGMVWGENTYSNNRYLSAAAIGFRHKYYGKSGMYAHADIFMGRAISTPEFIQRQTTIGVSAGMGF